MSGKSVWDDSYEIAMRRTKRFGKNADGGRTNEADCYYEWIKHSIHSRSYEDRLGYYEILARHHHLTDFDVRGLFQSHQVGTICEYEDFVYNVLMDFQPFLSNGDRGQPHQILEMMSNKEKLERADCDIINYYFYGPEDGSREGIDYVKKKILTDFYGEIETDESINNAVRIRWIFDVIEEEFVTCLEESAVGSLDVDFMCQRVINRLNLEANNAPSFAEVINSYQFSDLQAFVSSMLGLIGKYKSSYVYNKKTGGTKKPVYDVHGFKEEKSMLIRNPGFFTTEALNRCGGAANVCIPKEMEIGGEGK